MHDPTGVGPGTMEWASAHTWAMGESPNVCFVGNKIAGVFTKDKMLKHVTPWLNF